MATYRRHGRTALKCAVTLEHDAIGEWVVETRDVSATGIFIKCKALVGKIAVGDALLAKVCRGAQIVAPFDVSPSDLPLSSSVPHNPAPSFAEAPSLFTVVRLTEDGAALTYL